MIGSPTSDICSMATKYTREVLSEAVSQSQSFAGVLRFLGLRQAGGTQTHITTKIKQFGLDTTHFTGEGHNKGKPARNRLTSSQILVRLPEGSNRQKACVLKRAMLEEGLTYQCLCGNLGKWQGKPITLDVDHIDGDWLNNELDNLRFLCPNCHSQQTSTNMPHKYRTS